MKIERVDLTAFGPFTKKTLDLTKRASGLHLFYGDNEAGKSSSLRALKAWLFGIQARTTDNFIHSNAQLRIGGKLSLDDGSKIEFTRRKGNKNTLLDFLSDNPLDENALEPYLSGLSEEIFDRMYGINHQGLSEGGRALLEQSGDLGQALFSAAAGTASLREVLSDLKVGADELFRPKGSTKRINKSILAYKDAKKRIRASTLLVSAWKNLQKEIAIKDLEITKIDKKILQLSRKKNRLNRLDRVKGPLAERRDVLNRLANLKDVLLLPEDFGKKTQMFLGSLQNAKESSEKASTLLRKLKLEVESIMTRPDLLENEGTILALYKELGAVEKAIGDRPQHDGKRRMLRNEATELLRGFRPDLTIDNSEELRPLLNNKKWIESLSKQYSLIEQRKKKATATFRDLEEEQKAFKMELEVLGESNPDLSGLKTAVMVARKAGDLEKRLIVSRERSINEREKCEHERNRLGRFKGGTISTLSKLAMPVMETLDRFERKFDDLDKSTRDLEHRIDDLKKEHELANEELQTILLTTQIPSIEELDQARTKRDSHWHLIRRKFIQKEDLELPAHNELAFSELYESDVKDADNIADDLRTDADQVLRRTHLETKIKHLNSRISNRVCDFEKAIEDKEQCDKEWDEVWINTGIEPGSPREMGQWFLKVDRVLSRFEASNIATREASQLQAEYESHIKAISHQLAKLNNSVDMKSSNLEKLLSFCDQIIEKTDAKAERKRQLEHSIKEGDTRGERVSAEMSAIDAERKKWMDEWSQAIDGLGVKSDVHPTHAVEVFDKLLEFFEKLTLSEDLSRRIFGIDKVALDFEKRVIEFADGLKLKPKDMNPALFVTQLHRDLSQTREASASLIKIENNIKEQVKELESENLKIEDAEKQLSELRTKARIQTNEELEGAETRSLNKHRLQNRLEAIHQELTRNGDGLSVDNLELEAGNSDIDSIEEERNRTAEDLNIFLEQRDQLRDQRQSLNSDLIAMDSSDDSARALEESEQLLASISSDVQQYLKLRIASLMLDQQIEKYRKANQGPVLTRASELFSVLTLNSFVALRDEIEKGKPIILGVRPDNREVTIDKMSDGTRDQLFLALRLATLEQHLKKGEPMPFIVDDILIGFDDKRTRVCLKILADLGKKTQVLLFTHHRRVIELAREQNTELDFFVHEL